MLPISRQIIHYENFVLEYCFRLRQPLWVFEVLRKENLLKNKSFKRPSFEQEVRVAKIFRSSNSDYKGSGYDRGHMAAAANHKHCIKAYKKTFHFTNISPQDTSINRGVWNKLEERGRYLALTHGVCRILSGILFLPGQKSKNAIKYKVIGKNFVAVPTHHFKVLYANKKTEAYIIPNFCMQSHDALPFLCTVEKVQHLSGLLFDMENLSN